MADILTDALLHSGRFIIVERQQIRDVLKEQDFAQSGRTVEAAAPKIGRLLNAQVLVTGSVVDFAETHSQMPAMFGYGGGGYRDRRGRWHHREGMALQFSYAEARVVIAMRLIDATTGQVLDSQESRGTASSNSVGVNVYQGMTTFRSAGFAKTPLGQATQKAIDQAVAFVCTRMQNVPWEGRVVDVKGDDVFINAGANQGITVGQEFLVFRESAPMIDPETGLPLGAPRKEIGLLSVSEVEPKFSIARIVRGQGITRKDVIQFLVRAQPVVTPPPVLKKQ